MEGTEPCCTKVETTDAGQPEDCCHAPAQRSRAKQAGLSGANRAQALCGVRSLQVVVQVVCEVGAHLDEYCSQEGGKRRSPCQTVHCVGAGCTDRHWREGCRERFGPCGE